MGVEAEPGEKSSDNASNKHHINHEGEWVKKSDDCTVGDDDA